MITNPRQFASDWCAAWNRHDVEGVLIHFHDDVVFTSSVALSMVPESGGVVRGKAALRDYWTLALTKIPDLHFTIIGVYAGVDTIVIHYRNQRDVEMSEVLVFGDELARFGYAAYAA